MIKLIYKSKLWFYYDHIILKVAESMHSEVFFWTNTKKKKKKKHSQFFTEKTNDYKVLIVLTVAVRNQLEKSHGTCWWKEWRPITGPQKPSRSSEKPTD